MAWDDRLADSLIRATSKAFSGSSSITYSPAGGAPVDLSGRSIYTSAHQEEVLDEAEVSVQTVKATLDVRLADLGATPAEDDDVQVGALAFKVSAIEVDGEGGALLILEEVG